MGIFRKTFLSLPFICVIYLLGSFYNTHLTINVTRLSVNDSRVRGSVVNIIIIIIITSTITITIIYILVLYSYHEYLPPKRIRHAATFTNANAMCLLNDG